MEYLEWRKGLHACGHHLSDSMITDPKRPPIYQAGVEECAACKEIGKHQHEQALKDREAAKNDVYVPTAARVWWARLFQPRGGAAHGSNRLGQAGS